MKPSVLWITRTAVSIALLVVMQMITAPLGNQFVTGSIVNLLLICPAMLFGLASGMTVAAVSPITAKLLGIGPLWGIIPFLVLGNIALQLVWYVIGNHLNKRDDRREIVYRIITIASAAIVKFLVLYLGVARLAVPVFLRLPERQAAVITTMFSIPQLITATIGGILAAALLPTLRKAILYRKG